MRMRLVMSAAVLALTAQVAVAQSTLDRQVLEAQQARDDVRGATERARRAVLALVPAMRSGAPDSPAALQARDALLLALRDLQEAVAEGGGGQRQEAALQSVKETEAAVRQGVDALQIERAFQDLELALIAYETARVAQTGPTLDLDADVRPATPGDEPEATDAAGADQPGAFGEIDLQPAPMAGPPLPAGMSLEDLIGWEVQSIGGERLGEVRDLVLAPETGLIDRLLVAREGPAGEDVVAFPWDQVRLDRQSSAIVTTMSRPEFQTIEPLDGMARQGD